MSDDLCELWRELNHWWMWLIFVAVLLTELAAAAGWLTAGCVVKRVGISALELCCQPPKAVQL